MEKMSGVDNNEDKKPVTHINLKVKDMYGKELFFRIRKITQLKTLMDAYCDKQSMERKAIVFFFDGNRIPDHGTPDQLGMEDGDEIDAFFHQMGGGGFLLIWK